MSREELEDTLPHGAGEVPGLATVLVAARAIDRAVAHLIDGLLDLDEHQLAEVITGVPLEQWLAIVGRRTRSDRRMLLTTCDVLRRLPSLRAAFIDEGSVSWAQTRAIVLTVERVPHHLDDAIDAALADSIRTCRQDDPDSLVGAVSRALRSIEATAAPERERHIPEQDFLALQPRLDGTGGRIHGELGALGFATVDAALTPSRQELAQDPGPTMGAAARGRARRLVGLCDASLAGGHGVTRGGDAAAPGGVNAVRGCDDAAPDCDGAIPGGDGTCGCGGGSRSSGSRPQLVIRVELSTLLDGAALPAELLTGLTGGKLWLDADTVRALVEQRGADLRAVVLEDTGRVVGIGRRSRVPPGWLRDATLALHDTCSAPGCLRPARSSELDHARPWHPIEYPIEYPIEPGHPGGRTDVDELAPVCAPHNRTKERAGWRVSQTADGVRRWRHPATGLSATTRPATWYARPCRDGDDPSSEVRSGRLGDGPDLARERRPTWDAGRAPPRPRAAPVRSRGPTVPRPIPHPVPHPRVGEPRLDARRGSC